MTCYLWRIEVPVEVRKIAEDKSDQMARMMVGKPVKQVKTISTNVNASNETEQPRVFWRKVPKHDPPVDVKIHDVTADDHPLRIGFRFLADMINRLFFILITAALTVACFTTLLQISVGAAGDNMKMIKELEADAMRDIDNLRMREGIVNNFKVCFD